MNRNKNFEIETSGSLMRTEYVSVTKNLTIEEAIVILRKNVKIKNNIHYMYVVDEYDTLVGVLTIRELLAADSDEKIKNVMVEKVIGIPVQEDQEDVARIFRDTDLVSMPVINDAGQIIGVIHVEDILDLMQREATEDFHIMASVATDSPEYAAIGLMDASVSLLYRKRIVWLVVLVCMNVFSGAGIAYFEDIIETNVALVFFLPRSEEHTSELQSRGHLVCRLLLEKK